MLIAKHESLFSNDYVVLEDGEEVCHVDMAWVREAGELTLGGEKLRVGREGWHSGEFFVESGGERLATAKKPSAFTRVFQLHVGDNSYALRPASMWRREFALRDGERTIGTVAPAGWFTRNAEADLPRDWPIAVRVFVIWLVLLMWMRARDSSHQ